MTLSSSSQFRGCFTDGQLISHTITNKPTWWAIYDANLDVIRMVFDVTRYGSLRNFKSLSGFASAHYKEDKPDRTSSANGWKECKCKIDENWISTATVREQTPSCL